MKKIILITILLLSFARTTSASVKHAGEIFLDVENHGEAWYVSPVDGRRYFLGRPDDAFRIMREHGVGISESGFAKIDSPLIAASDVVQNIKPLAGRIILQVEKNGEAWYINPRKLTKHYLGRPADAFQAIRSQGIGITRANLARIHKSGIDESINQYSKYSVKNITTRNGDIFKTDIIEIDLKNPKLKIKTDTADDHNCKQNCQASDLADFTFDNDGFAAMNGSYFCSGGGCGTMNYYFFPVYNSRIAKFINEDQLKYPTTGPLMAFDMNNKFYYFKDSRDFKSVVDFEKKYNTKLQAAIGNKPRLVENYMNQLIDWEVDAKQKDAKVLRNAIGYKDEKIFLVVARSANVIDIAEIMIALGVEYALNMDGGYSTALIYNGEYMLGPGRNIPNAIVFAEAL